MATFIVLGNFTDQGIRNVKQTTQRAKAFREIAQKAGVKVKEIYWTLGEYDVVVIMDAPNDETATSLLLSVGSLGNIRSKTLRAFSEDEMGKIITKVT
jgi:uncharacterized protein with GYD domain